MFKLVIAAILLLSSSSLVSCRNINAAGLALIKEFEGFMPNFYYDAAGYRTIGYGHNCDAHRDCDSIIAPITEAQASAILIRDLVTYETCVDRQVPTVNDNQFAALASFTFNLGCGNFQSSTLLVYLKAGDIGAASREFGRWIYSGGVILPGLVRRREAERVLFCTGGVC